MPSPDPSGPGAVMLRDATADDFEAMLHLNEASVAVLSPLDLAGLERLVGYSSHVRVAGAPGRVEGFLLAMREGTAYDSPNYRWFAARYPRFVYVDRVVIDAASRGRGLGVALYEDIIALARASGVVHLVSEYDSEPMNEASRRFHDRFGFREVGTQRVAGGAKAVSLQERAL